MSRILILAVILSGVVDFLLLLGTNRLCDGDYDCFRCALGAALSALHAGACIFPGFHFLGNLFWRSIFIGLVSTVAFGIVRSTLYKGAVFWLLRMALSGMSVYLNNQQHWMLILVAGGICLLCVVLFRIGIGTQQYIPVELCYGDRRMKLTALRDTGNTLLDPVSGQSVLVVGADAAEELTGLTREQLKCPVESLGTIPGLRLIPYRTIGKEAGFLLGLRLSQVQVGGKRGSRIVAFAPECLSANGGYQVLTGGIV